METHREATDNSTGGLVSLGRRKVVNLVTVPDSMGPRAIGHREALVVHGPKVLGVGETAPRDPDRLTAVIGPLVAIPSYETTGPSAALDLSDRRNPAGRTADQLDLGRPEGNRRGEIVQRSVHPRGRTPVAWSNHGSRWAGGAKNKLSFRIRKW